MRLELAVLRLDADLYESTMDVLTALYDCVSPGGAVIIDDWDVPTARQAVLNFRALRRRRQRQAVAVVAPVGRRQEQEDEQSGAGEWGEGGDGDSEAWHSEAEPLVFIDQSSVYWRKTKES